MATFQTIGDKQSLSKGPRNYDRTKFQGGRTQQVGDRVAMSASPVPPQNGKNGVRGGSYQQVGDSVSLSKTPQKGWASASTPMSERAKQQSVMPGVSGKGKGRKG